MIILTDYNIDLEKIQEANSKLPEIDFKFALNEPTGDFFYDPWRIKSEFKDTVWEDILNSLDTQKGEARLIALEPGKCYLTHADIDDRWHLSIAAEESFLVDVGNGTLTPIEVDGRWYDMNAGGLHSAVNFSNKIRVQLVVRKLLNKNDIKDPVSVKIKLAKPRPDYRYIFDHLISPWLNQANKKGYINSFVHTSEYAGFNVDRTLIPELQSKLDENFILEID